MPRFFFDFDDGEQQTLDAEGSDYLSVEAAYADARRALLETAAEWRSSKEKRSAICRVRGEANSSIHTIALGMNESSASDVHALWGSSLRSATDLSH